MFLPLMPELSGSLAKASSMALFSEVSLTIPPGPRVSEFDLIFCPHSPKLPAPPGPPQPPGPKPPADAGLCPGTEGVRLWERPARRREDEEL